MLHRSLLALRATTVGALRPRVALFATKAEALPSIPAAASDGSLALPSGLHYNADAAEVAVTGSVHTESAGRTAVIVQAAKSAMTSGLGNEKWTIRFNHTDKWGMPLMGWLSAADTLSQVTNSLQFESKEEAIRVAERNGWKYELLEPTAKSQGVVKSYAYNFLAEAVESQLKLQGPRKAKAIFTHSTKLGSHWVNLKRSTFGKEPWTPNK